MAQTILFGDELKGDSFLTMLIFKDEGKPLFHAFLCRRRGNLAF
jgi:hypothetical protein